jgi:poly(hydroxyalkanoate) depolymerase family esterase
MIATAEAALTPVSDFGTNPGALDMFEYVPANLPSGRPLVVVMHGCTQTAAAMEAAGWDALADKYQFAVLYPQQRNANQQLGCFTWYATGDITRDAGEAQSIVQMIDKAIATHHLDAGRVYATGLSAGAAMTAVMLAAYPDRFRAGSIMAGVPYGCATDVSSGQSCASSGTSKTPEQWGDAVRAAYPSFAGPWPRVQIWHGSSDYTVATANATELVKQWTNVWGIDATADATEMISSSTRTQYTSGSKLAVELYLVSGMGHAIATGADAMGMCPATSGAFFSDQKICSTLRAAQFFGLLGDDSGNPDGTGSGSGSGDGSGDDGDAGGGCNAAGTAGLAVIAAYALLALVRRRR